MKVQYLEMGAFSQSAGPYLFGGHQQKIPVPINGFWPLNLGGREPHLNESVENVIFGMEILIKIHDLNDSFKNS